MRKAIWLLLAGFCAHSFADEGAKEDNNTKAAALYGSDYITKPFWSMRPTYRLQFTQSNIRDVSEQGCDKPDDKNAKRYSAGPKSIFKELKAGEKYKIIEFTFVETDVPSQLRNKDNDYPEYAVIGRPYLLCIGKQFVPDYAFKRTGGMKTGMLVVPFKLRDGDIFSDSTVGPYVAFSGNTFSLLGTLGLTQITVSDLSSEGGLKTETGISLAVGFVWTLSDDFDAALVVGADHLSGAAGDTFKYQDERWISFAIGYNFTK